MGVGIFSSLVSGLGVVSSEGRGWAVAQALSKIKPITQIAMNEAMRPPNMPKFYTNLKSQKSAVLKSVLEAAMKTELVTIHNPEELNLILGQSHFIKTVEDLHEVLVSSVPGIKFGLAFCEASTQRLVRWSGNDGSLIELAKQNALLIGAGHSFIIFLGQGFFPINVLNQIKQVPEVCRIFCATANPVQVVVAESEQGRGILGVIDGESPIGVETEEEIAGRIALLRRFGYKAQ
jgi:adenosine/AMP kinase